MWWNFRGYPRNWRRAYEKEIGHTVKQIKHEQKYMSYESWNAYCKILKENTHGNRNEGSLSEWSDLQTFWK